MIAALTDKQECSAPVVVVVAHPDDETIGMASCLRRLTNLTLVVVTDGAPANMHRARALGFGSVEEYSIIRFSELDKALELLGARPVRRLNLGFSDGGTVFKLTEIAEKIEVALADSSAVITHAYEGGHPDHDVCALAVQSACARMAKANKKAPQRLEFAGYFSRAGQLSTNCFWPDPRSLELPIRLSWLERRRKRKAMRAFRTQSFILKEFPPNRESYRRAPVYQFLNPPPPGEWYYDRYDWPLKGEDWLRSASDFLSTANSLDSLADAGGAK